jgi:hypothetical protein
MGLPSGRPASEALIWRGSRGEIEKWSVKDLNEETFVEGSNFEEASACYLGRCRNRQKVASGRSCAEADCANPAPIIASVSGTLNLSGTLVNRMTIINLQRPSEFVTLYIVKRWHYILLAIILVLCGVYIALHWRQLGFGGLHRIGADDSRDLGETAASPQHPAIIEWQKINRTADGFKVEMPADVKQIQIPAYTENGGTEQVDMIFSNPDAETTFSVVWKDNPPVARANNRVPDLTLAMARDGAVTRTQTTLVSDAASSTQGFPGRTFEARNTGGGVMNSRLIYTGSRLYMLIASFPSINARRDRDVTRFFNSFTIATPSGASSPANGKDESKDSTNKD